MPRTFHITFTVDCEIELDDEVIDRVDDEWRSVLYQLHTPIDIAEHIAYNLIMNNVHLSLLDGWGDMKDAQAKISSKDTYQWESKETTPT